MGFAGGDLGVRPTGLLAVRDRRRPPDMLGENAAQVLASTPTATARDHIALARGCQSLASFTQGAVFFFFRKIKELGNPEFL